MELWLKFIKKMPDDMNAYHFSCVGTEIYSKGILNDIVQKRILCIYNVSRFNANSQNSVLK